MIKIDKTKTPVNGRNVVPFSVLCSFGGEINNGRHSHWIVSHSVLLGDFPIPTCVTK